MELFEDPVARRELRVAARRWQTYLPRLLVGLALAWITGYLWSESSKSYSYRWSFGTSRLADLSRETFMILFAVEMIFLPLLAASSASDLVTREVRQGTLGLLLLTPLSPWRIAFGKWKAAVAQTAALLILGAPLVAVCIYLGGIGPDSLPWGIALPLASSAFAAALSLLGSTFFRTPSMVVVVTVVLLVFGVAGPGIVLEGIRGSKSDLDAWAHVHPVYAALAMLRSFGPGPFNDMAWIPASGVAVALSLLLVFLASRRLQGRVDVLAGPSLFSRLMGSIDAGFEQMNAGRKSWFSSGEVWQSQALLWKELRLRAAGRLRYATRVGLALLLALILMCGMFGSVMDSLAAFAWGLSILVAIQALVTGVGLFTAEKEGRQWDVLLSTPLRSGEILRAKLLSGGAALGPGAVIAGLYALALTVTINQPRLVWALAVPVGLFVAFVFLAAAAASLRCATYRGAFGLAMGFVIGSLVGLPMVIAAVKLFDLADFDGEWWIAVVSPVWHLNAFSEKLWRGTDYWGWEGSPGDGAALAYLALYGTLCAALAVWMRFDVDRVAKRA